MPMERLDKVLAAAAGISRREARLLVRQGRVTVDGAAVTAPEEKAAETAVIRLDGAVLDRSPFVYLLLHKPAGVITATEDRRQATVLSLVPEAYRRRDLSPVGRLDKDTEGLLLLTNDGALHHRLISPRCHVDKRYYARVEGALTPEDADAFAAGIALSDFTCLPAELEILSPHECVVTVREGKYHQVRRMLASRGKPVTYLKRLSMGPLTLEDTLPAGALRPLEPREIQALRQTAGL